MAEIDLDGVREGLEAAVAAASKAILDVLEQDTIRVGHKPGEGPVTQTPASSISPAFNSVGPQCQ